MVKVPRFAFEKFPAADPTLTTTMKSVGEAMAIGRNFTEALGKALRSIDKRGADVPLGRRAADRRGARRPARRDRAARPSSASSRSSRRCARRRARRDRRAGLRGDRHRPVVPRPDPARSTRSPRQVAAVARRSTPRRAAHAKRHGLSDAQIAALRGTRARPRARARGTRSACARSTRPSTPAPPSSRPARRTTTRRYDEETEVAPARRGRP